MFYMKESYEGVLDFYMDRLRACPLYGFKSGHEILQTVIRCALSDSFLTLSEFNSIMNVAENAHIKMMEDNYNAGWQDE